MIQEEYNKKLLELPLKFDSYFQINNHYLSYIEEIYYIYDYESKIFVK